MAGHAGAIQINFGVTPLVLRISRGQSAALIKGRRACRADLNVSSRASDGNQGQAKSCDGRCQPELCRGEVKMKRVVIGILSIYGMGWFPVTLYKEQLL
jgi:hypothetical protein